MKAIILSILALLATSAAWGETGCRTVEHPDHVEAICVGDEAPLREQIPRAQGKHEPDATKTVPSPQQADPAARTGLIHPATSSNQKQPAGGTAPVQNNISTSRGTSETPAEHLARRRALAIQNTQKIKAIAAPVQPAK